MSAEEIECCSEEIDQAALDLVSFAETAEERESGASEGKREEAVSLQAQGTSGDTEAVSNGGKKKEDEDALTK